MNRPSSRPAALVLACSLLGVTPLWAQSAAPAPAGSAPRNDHATRWIVPYPAGGGSDFLARTIGQAMAQQTGRPVIIDNRPGGNTAIGAAETLQAAPDGRTVLSADNGTMVFNQALYRKLSYDPASLAPVTLMGRFPMILVVSPDSGIDGLPAFVAKAKAAGGGGLNYASAGAGSPHHLAMELLKVEAGLPLQHVAYKGAAPALQDVAGGQVPAMMVDLAAGRSFIQAGKVKPIAVASASRLRQLADVPTFAELGLKNVEAAALVGLVVPVATPADTIAALNRDVVRAIAEPAVNQRLVEFGVEPVGSTPAQYAELLRAETTRWHRLIRDQHITLD